MDGWLPARLPILNERATGSKWPWYAGAGLGVAIASPAAEHAARAIEPAPQVSVRDRLRWVVWQTNNGVPWQTACGSSNC